MSAFSDRLKMCETRLEMFGCFQTIEGERLRNPKIALLKEELRTKTALRTLNLGFNQLTGDEAAEITLNLRGAVGAMHVI